MESKECKSFRTISYEDELERAKFLKDDLQKGDGWSLADSGHDYSFWIKTFHNDETPIKVVYDIDMPFPAKVFGKLLDPEHLEERNDWDKTFFDHQCLEAFPEEGSVTYMRVPLSFPLNDRSFVLYLPHGKEVDWFGNRATLLLIKNAWHSSKPIGGADGVVRATNGGNFYVVSEDEKQPETACHVFGLTCNLYNGWIPKTNMEWMQKRIVPGTFLKWRENMITGYETYFKH